MATSMPVKVKAAIPVERGSAYGGRFAPFEPGVLGASEVAAVLAYLESHPTESGAPLRPDGTPNLEGAFRYDVCRLGADFDPDGTVGDRIADGVRAANEHFGFEFEFLEYNGVLVYEAGGSYLGGHFDSYFTTEGLDRKLTFTIPLNPRDAYAGGDLVIAGEPRPAAECAVGGLTAFPSFLLHTVTPVTSGRRVCLVGWAWGERWR